MKYKLMVNNSNMASTNSYLIYDEESKDAWIIDGAFKAQKFIDKIKEEGLNLKALLLTHGHWDHIMAAEYWRDRYNIPIVIHEKGQDYLTNPKINGSFKYSDMDDYSFEADTYLQGDNGKYDIFTYYYTPGHSYDHLMYKVGNIIFCGDLIFKESVGRTDLPGSNHSDLVKSIRNVVYREFEDMTILLPGHGGQTSVGYEKLNNPWVPFEE